MVGRVGGSREIVCPGLYLRNRKVWEVHTWQGHWLGGVDVQHHGVTLI